jgi:hypothetical protein
MAYSPMGQHRVARPTLVFLGLALIWPPFLGASSPPDLSGRGLLLKPDLGSLHHISTRTSVTWTCRLTDESMCPAEGR